MYLISIIDYSKSVSYDNHILLKLGDIKSLEHGRKFQSLVLLYKGLYNQEAPYINEFFNLILRMVHKAGTPFIQYGMDA